MWFAAIVGSIYGLLFTIVGYLLDWGPGSSMEGPFWIILLASIPFIFFQQMFTASPGDSMMTEMLRGFFSPAVMRIGKIFSFGGRGHRLHMG